MIAPRRSDSTSLLHIRKGEGRLQVSAFLIKVGEDYLIIICGGEKPHIGGFALSIEGNPPVAFSLPRHKDYLVAVKAASLISRSLGRTCLAVAGIHVENASREDIEKLIEHSEECVHELISTIQKSESHSSEEQGHSPLQGDPTPSPQ
ncbi:MAG TPA: hypothetical protein ENF82_04060 [Candidatus Methanomethylia archaeon]|nr:hypothetical protein [Candidatus Methanomethylicia archaeon]